MGVIMNNKAIFNVFFREKPAMMLVHLKNAKTSKAYRLSLKQYFNFKRSKEAGLRPLLKDPIAIMSCEWLAETFNMDVIVVIRHPAAFVASLKVAGWEFAFVNEYVSVSFCDFINEDSGIGHG